MLICSEIQVQSDGVKVHRQTHANLPLSLISYHHCGVSGVQSEKDKTFITRTGVLIYLQFQKTSKNFSKSCHLLQIHVYRLELLFGIVFLFEISKINLTSGSVLQNSSMIHIYKVQLFNVVSVPIVVITTTNSRHSDPEQIVKN